MVIFIDGWQNTGKSTLIENCKYKHSRFPFNQYLDLLDLKNDINGYQLGKDLGILFLSNFLKDPLVLDRGPFSTIFYSLKEKRYGENTELILAKFLKELTNYKNCRFVFVVKKNETNPQERIHNDGFDYLNDDKDPEKEKLLKEIVKAAQNYGIKIYIFENDYSLSLKTNYHRFNDFLEGIFDEYN